MGDRTWVTLVVLNEHASTVEGFDDMNGEFGDADENTTSYFFDEVNYGDLNGYVPDGGRGMMDKIRDANIPYDLEYGAGCEYGAGYENFRILEDGTQVMNDGETATIGLVSINDLEQAIGQAREKTGVCTYSQDALNKVGQLIKDVKTRDYPPFSLIENRKYLK